MMNQCDCFFRDYLSQRLDKTLGDTSSACPVDAALAVMSSTACTELLHAKDHCCTLTFMLYLCFCCKDVEGLVSELRQIVLDVYAKERTAG